MTKDKPLIEEVVEWINPWGDKESAIPTRKVAEAVKKLKEDILFRKEFAQNEDEDIVLRDLLIDIDKIMGNFPNAKGESVMYEPAKKIMGNFNHYSLDNKTVTKNKDTTVSNSKDKGCGEKYCWENKDFQVITMIIPKCEIGLKEDKQ